MSDNVLHGFLCSHELVEVVREKLVLVDVEANTSIEDALAVLKQFSITSLPVWGKKGHWIGAGGECDVVVDEKQYIGIVSISDLVLHLITAKDVEKALKQRVADAIGATTEGRSLWTRDKDTKLIHAIEPLGKHVHRALVQQDAHHYALLTQTDIVQFMMSHSSDIQSSPLFSMPISEVLETVSNSRDRPSHVVSLPESSQTIDALKTFRESGCTALPIVNENDQVIATFSNSDLRGMTWETLQERVKLPLLDFLRRQQHGTHDPNATPNKNHKLNPPVTCTESTRLGDALAEIVHHRVHRVWVVDKDGVLKDVLSLTDIIAAMHIVASTE